MKRISDTAARNIETPIGVLGLCARDGFLTAVKFHAVETFGEDEVLDVAARQLEEYFSGSRREFDIPMDMGGTDFQRKCWQALTEIPYGETMTYGELARKIAEKRGIPQMSAQAVGQAVGWNPIGILIPCHRIIGSDGALVGYGGGLENKKWLLEHDQKSRKEA